MGKEDQPSDLIKQAKLTPEQLHNCLRHFVGQVLIDGLVEIDEGPYLDKIQEEILTLKHETESDREMLTSIIPMRLLKDAFSAKDWPETTEENKKAIALAYDQKQTKMSEIVKGGYGVCRHYHVISLLVAETLKMPFVLQGNPDKRHTFGKIKFGEEWLVVDPFANDYLHNQGKQYLFFPSDWYEGYNIITFEKTSVTSLEEKP